MKFLLDTDHTTVLQHRDGSGLARLLERVLEHGPENVAYSVVSFHEQTMGCHAYINRAKTSVELARGYSMLSRLIKMFAKGPVLPFDEAAISVCDDLAKQRLRVGTMDLRIASIPLSRDLTLLTRNVADFGKIPGLRTEDWTR